jgi:hypothetical protein
MGSSATFASSLLAFIISRRIAQHVSYRGAAREGGHAIS